MYQQANPNEMPGVGTTFLATYKPIWKGRGGVQYLPGGGTIDGANARDPSNVVSGSNLPNANASYVNVLQPGLLLGKITASGFYGASIFGATTTLVTAATSTTFKVSGAVGAEIIRRLGGVTGALKLSGPATTGGAMNTDAVTVTGIATADGGATYTVTLSAAPTHGFMIGSLVQPADGSETIKTFIDEEDGIRVTDINGGSLTLQFPRIPITGGVVYAANLVNYTAEPSIKTWIKTALKAVGPFMFDDDL